VEKHPKSGENGLTGQEKREIVIKEADCAEISDHANMKGTKAVRQESLESAHAKEPITGHLQPGEETPGAP